MESAVNREHPSKDGHETLDLDPDAAVKPRVDHLACAILTSHKVAFDCMCPYIIKNFLIPFGIALVASELNGAQKCSEMNVPVYL